MNNPFNNIFGDIVSALSGWLGWRCDVELRDSYALNNYIQHYGVGLSMVYKR